MDIDHQFGGSDGAILIVRLPQDLNHETVEPLRGCVARSLPNRDGAGVVLDMSAVEMISSIGIAALLQVQELCRDRGAGVVLAQVPERQLAFLRMLKLDRKFGFAPTVDDAVDALERGDGFPSPPPGGATRDPAG